MLLKKFLNVINSKEIESGKTWYALALAPNNLVWPSEGSDPVVRAEGTAGVARAVEERPGSVGYGALSIIRGGVAKFIPPLGGSGRPTFWVTVQNGVDLEKNPTYADPSTNEEAEAKAKSNCEETFYTDGAKKWAPSTEETWIEVTTAKKEQHYPVCGFMYDFSLTKFNGVHPSSESPTAGSVRTAFDYLNFVLSSGTGGGQTHIDEGEDLLSLPVAEEAQKNVLKRAREGVSKIAF